MELSGKDSKKIEKSYSKYFFVFATLIITFWFIYNYENHNNNLAQHPYDKISLSEETKKNDATLIKELLSTDAQFNNTASASFSSDYITDVVKRYQSNQGIISANVSYGHIGPITRASLSSEFSNQKGGIAIVEGDYSDALLLENGKFLKTETTQSNLVSEKTINVWIKPYALTKHKDFLLGDKESGYGVGLNKYGKIYARTPKGDVTTTNRYVEVGDWQHIGVSISNPEVSFFYNNELVESINIDTYMEYQTASVASSVKNTELFIVRAMSGFFSSVLSELKEPQEDNKIIDFIASIFTNKKSNKDLYYLDQKLTIFIPPTLEVFEEKVVVVEEVKEDIVKLKEEENKTISSTSTTESILEVGSTTSLSIGTSTSIVDTEIASSSVEEFISTSTVKKEETFIEAIVSPGGGGQSSVTIDAIPVVVLNGSDSIEIELGTIYIDPGATAYDEEDGNITSNIVVSGEVDHTTPGDYLITYNVIDSGGNSGIEVARIVVVSVHELTKEEQEPQGYDLAEEGQDVAYKISSANGADPIFVEVDIKPLHVFVGDTQTMTVKVKSDSGVSSVQSVTELDTTTLTLDFDEISSDESGTIFSTSWIVSDTHTEIYRTKFIAINTAGESNSTIMAWSDPCTGLTDGQDSTLTQTSCAVSGVYGLDGGSLTIPSGKSITLNEGSSWVWNPGKSITINGTINIAKTGVGASIKKGYLFYSGTDYDTANTLTRVYGSSDTKSGHVRVSWWEGITPTSCTLSASPTSVTQGSSSTLTWTTTGDEDSFSINQGVGSKPIISGNVSVSPSSTLTYTGTVSGDGGTNTCTATVTVTVPAPTCSLTSSPTGWRTAIQNTTLSWSTTNATSFSINYGVGSGSIPTGSTSVSPNETTTYTGTVIGNGGTAYCSNTIAVEEINPPDCNPVCL